MKKIKGKGKIILYAASGMGINLLNLMMSSYLCSALLSSGFGEEAIKNQTFLQKDLVVAGGWIVFGAIAKILDGVIDVPMAAFTDGLRTKFGRRRPALLIGLIPLLLSYCAFLFVPNDGETWLNTVYFGIILCVFYSFYTLTMVNYYATFTEIVETEEERNLLSNAKSVYDIFYFIIGYVAVAALLKGMHITTVALIVLPVSLTMLIPLFMIKEPDMTTVEAAEKQPRVGLVKSLSITFKNKSFIVWMVVYSFMTFGVQLFLSGINEYFSNVGMSMIIVMATSFAPVPFTLMIYDKLLRKHGFVFAYRYALIMYISGMSMMFCVSFLGAGMTKTILSVITGLISSFSIGALFAVAYSVPSQLAADEEKKTGVSNSAMYFAVQGLFSGVATAIGSYIVLTVLKKTDEVKLLTLICAIGVAVSLAFTFILPESLHKMGKKDK